MSYKGSVLLISHDAHRTGAPVMVLNMAELLSEMGNKSFSFLIRNPVGELMADFRTLGPTYVPLKATSFQKAKRKLLGSAVPLLPRLPYVDIILSNTITNGELYPELAAKGTPIVTFVHELELATKTYTTAENLGKVLKFTNVFAVPSLAVYDFLTKDLGVSPEKVIRMDYYVPNHEKTILDPQKKEAPFVVGGVGTTDWRKGTDLFLAVAKEYSIQYPNSNVTFKWKGANFDSVEYQRLEYEVKKAGLEKVVSFERADADLASFYNGIHLFLLTSREDPYPLVALEAAKHKMPTICFEGSGGIPEFIRESGGGKLAPFLGISPMARAIHEYVINPEDLNEDGLKAFKKLQQRHYDKAHITKQLEQILEICKNKEGIA